MMYESDQPYAHANAAMQASSRITGAGAGYQNAIPQTSPETELGYAARCADESVCVLEKLLAEMHQRLAAVLIPQGPETPNTGEKKAARAVSSPMASALMTHTHRVETLQRALQDMLRRLAL